MWLLKIAEDPTTGYTLSQCMPIINSTAGPTQKENCPQVVIQLITLMS